MDMPLFHLKSRHLSGETGGMFAVCSAHPMVLEASMALAVAENQPLLVEATANQVNPAGGYTGMTPAEFKTFVYRLAATVGLPADRLFIGADHLGPHIWKEETAAEGMKKAIELARQCVAAGFHKIHLDTGTRCKDDPEEPLALETAAERAAILCLNAEQAAKGRPEADKPLYVIGNEVPQPGGGLEEGQCLVLTDPETLAAVVRRYAVAFHDSRLSAAWKRVVAIVVQPGVDFGDRVIAPYNKSRTEALSKAHDRLPGIMTFEIHATDFQSPDALRQMVQDHFLLLKTGPCLTFAFREAVYALAHIEEALPRIRNRSHLQRVMETLMTGQPNHWVSHYREKDADDLRFLRHYGYRDRIRYYWARTKAVAAVDQLLKNLISPLPGALIRQYFPDFFPEIESGLLQPFAKDLIRRRIQQALKPYVEACR